MAIDKGTVDLWLSEAFGLKIDGHDVGKFEKVCDETEWLTEVWNGGEKLMIWLS